MIIAYDVISPIHCTEELGAQHHYPVYVMRLACCST